MSVYGGLTVAVLWSLAPSLSHPQERVITGVREAARLHGGALDQTAREQLEAAAAKIAELTAAISKQVSLSVSVSLSRALSR